jgi:hypothetical protein
MSTQTRSSVDHSVGPRGTVILKVPAGGVTVQGVDGEVARISSPSGRDLSDDYRIDAWNGRLEMTPRDGLASGFGWFNGRRYEPIHAEVPRGADLRIETASGSVTVEGLRGEQHYRAASGSVELTDVAGSITIDHVSGDVRVRGSGRLSLVTRTVSGELDVAAPSFDRLQARLMSGTVRIAGRLVGEGPFAVENVSGDVSIELDGPVRIEGSHVAGRIHTDLPHRDGGSPGRRTVEIGDNGPLVTFRTVAGDLRVIGPRSVEPAPTPTMEPTPTSQPAPTASSEPEASTDDVASRRLAILKELELGSIDIAAASERLAQLDAEEERARAHTRSIGIGPLHAELRWDHRA